MSPAAPDALPVAGLERPARGWWRSPWIVAAATLLTFADSGPNGFAYDDLGVILDNPRIRTLANLPQIFLTDYWYETGETTVVADPNRDRLYRPLTLASYALNYAVGGVAPVGYHVVNIGLHVIAAMLCWWFVRRLVDDADIATIASLLFSLHPLRSEAVANVVGRAEILSGGFLLLGLLALLPKMLNTPIGPGRAAVAGLAFFAALLSKETAICYPAVAGLVLLGWIGLRGGRVRNGWLVAVVLLLPAALYLGLRYYALDGHLIRTQPPSPMFNPLVGQPIGERLLGPLTILGWYIRLLVVPTQLSSDYNLAVFNPAAGANGLTLLGGVAALVFAALVVMGLRRDRTARWLALSAGLCIVSYALVSNTVLLIGVAIADRLTYWPAVPVSLLSAIAVTAVWRRETRPGGQLVRAERLLRIVGIALLAAFALRSATRNLDWRDNLTLYRADAANFPRSAMVNHGLGLAEFLAAAELPPGDERTEQLKAADAAEARAIEIYPFDAEMFTVRARAQYLLGDHAAARRYVDYALALEPRMTAALQVRDLLNGSPADGVALDTLRAALATRPSDLALRTRLAQALLAACRYADAIQELTPQGSTDSTDADALATLAQAYLLNHEEPRARELYQRVVVLRPDDWEAQTNLAILLAERDPPAALVHANRAYQLRPDDLRVAVNLAEAYAANGDIAAARAQYARLLERLPADDPYRVALRKRLEQLGG